MAGSVRLTFASAMLRVSPPWLRRRVGGAIMRGMGTVVDAETDRDVEGVEARFPGGTNGVAIHPEALGYIGRERRILRGPGETDETFALRLRSWWDAHRIRGSAYALAGQLHAFFLASHNVPIQIIANSGTRVSVDTNGVITRDSGPAGWAGDGEYPLKWARFFVLFFLNSEEFSLSPLEDSSGATIVTSGGDTIVASASMYDLSPNDIETLCSVPREWSAAHIDRIYLVLIPPGGIAWGVPDELQWGDAGKTWGGGLAVHITC